MKVNDLPPLSDILSMLRLDEISGDLFWVHGRSGRYARAGAKAGTTMRQGYVRIRFFGGFFLAHRIVWAIANGRCPSQSELVDHINGNRSDNRPENLRLATHSQNGVNSVAARGATGVRGVQFRPHRGGKPFVARISKGRPRYFSSKDEAALWVLAERVRVYGEFAPRSAQSQ